MTLTGTADLISAIIILFVVGTAIGNYATSLVYRLPRHLKIAYDPPYCDSCRTYLTTRDMFPFFSWILARGKCRTCGAKVPGLYTVIEFLCAVFLIAGMFQFGLSEKMLLVAAIGIFWLVTVSILFSAGIFATHAVILTAAATLIYRAVEDHSIFPAIRSGYLGLMAGLAVWGIGILINKIPSFQRKLESGAHHGEAPACAGTTQGREGAPQEKRRDARPPMPPAVMLITLATMATGTAGMPYLVIWTPILYLFIRGTSCVIEPTLKDWSWSWALFAATMLTLYCPMAL